MGSKITPCKDYEESANKYREYLSQHRGNVLKAAEEIIGPQLCKTLGVLHDALMEKARVHDASKDDPEEFEPYRAWYYPTPEDLKKDEAIRTEEYHNAWKHHQLHNDHHPEYWYRGNVNVEAMHPLAIAEMFCDWYSMSMFYRNSIHEWFKTEAIEHHKFVLHPKTLELINVVLDADWWEGIEWR